MSSDPGDDHTFTTKFRLPRRMWDTYGRVVGDRERSADLIAHVRRTIQDRGSEQDLADLAAADAELNERHARKGGRPPKARSRSAAAAELARAVAAQGGTWDTTRAVTALRDAGVPVGAGDRADEKQARTALRQLADEGVLARLDSPGNTAVYRRPEEEN